MKLLLVTFIAFAATVGARSTNRVASLKSLIGDRKKGEESDTHSQQSAKEEEDAGSKAGAGTTALAHMFLFAEDAEDAFSVKVAASPIQLPITANMQVRMWEPISEASPMTKQGYTHWMSDEKGFLFSNADGSKRSLCSNKAVAPADKVVTMSFKCEEQHPAPVPEAEAAATDKADTTEASDKEEEESEEDTPEKTEASTPGEARFKGGKSVSAKGKKAYPYSSLPYSSQYVPINTLGGYNQMGTTWMPCSDGLPYNWNSYDWGGWGNYPYYAINNMGYWGCPALTGSGMCSSNPYLYPFSP